MPRPKSWVTPTLTISSGFGYGTGLSSAASTTLKRAVDAPIAKASVRIVTAAKPR